MSSQEELSQIKVVPREVSHRRQHHTDLDEGHPDHI